MTLLKLASLKTKILAWVTAVALLWATVVVKLKLRDRKVREETLNEVVKDDRKKADAVRRAVDDARSGNVQRTIIYRD